MSNFKLNLPTDIPWERICVTEDMIDRVVCDDRLPAKWQTSMAVFKYKPDDEYQLYPRYQITYLKVTATITGYQPLDQEIQGTIDWSGINVDEDLLEWQEKLKAYHPCHGAILQVVVTPFTNTENIPSNKYPFFMDFEPKKRELYELATDTKEKQSRSVESLNITKSGGKTQSMEVLDVDMGGGGGGFTIAGVGGGNWAAPNGQWGTKRLNSEESMTTRSADLGQEKRESFSYSTQLSQMYTLLDSYHIGTNRVVFFIQPRPHTLEEPSGFVRGPRQVEGIQEFFMVVAQLKEQTNFCLSLRLDTSHITKATDMDYETKSEMSDSLSVTAQIATKNDRKSVSFSQRWRVDHMNWQSYQCYTNFKEDTKVVYQAPQGYEIVYTTDSINRNIGTASSTVEISPDKSFVTITVKAMGYNCFKTSGPGEDELRSLFSSANRQVEVHLISTTKNKIVGETEVLMITTRGLCCCSIDHDIKSLDEYVVDVKPIPTDLQPQSSTNENTNSYLTSEMQNLRPSYSVSENESKEELMKKYPENSKESINSSMAMKYNIRRINELSNYIKTETIKSLNDPTIKLKKYINTKFFSSQVENAILQTKHGRDILNKSISENFSNEILSKLQKYFIKEAKDISRLDILTLGDKETAKITGLKVEEVKKIKLNFLGIRFKSENKSEKPKKGSAGNSTVK